MPPSNTPCKRFPTWRSSRFVSSSRTSGLSDTCSANRTKLARSSWSATILPIQSRQGSSEGRGFLENAHRPLPNSTSSATSPSTVAPENAKHANLWFCGSSKSTVLSSGSCFRRRRQLSGGCGVALKRAPTFLPRKKRSAKGNPAYIAEPDWLLFRGDAPPVASKPRRGVWE